MNPYSPPASVTKGSRKTLRFMLVFVLFISLWPVLAIAIQTVEVIAENMLAFERVRISRFATRNATVQCMFLSVGSVACILAAVRDRNIGKLKSIRVPIFLTLLGVLVVSIEITLFHPPSAD